MHLDFSMGHRARCTILWSQECFYFLFLGEIVVTRVNSAVNAECKEYLDIV